MKKSALALILICISAVALAATPVVEQVTNLLYYATTASTGDAYIFKQAVSLRAHQANLYGASAVSASVTVQGSNDNVTWINLGTITLNAASAILSDGFVTQAPWAMERGKLDSISGVGASVTLTVGD